LFACACCRSAWHRIAEESGRNAIEVAERFADGQAGADELAAAFAAADECVNRLTGTPGWREGEGGMDPLGASKAARLAAHPDIRRSADEAAGHAAMGLALVILDLWDFGDERVRQCFVLREVAGNPFRPAPAVEPSVIEWNDGTPRQLAEAIYADRDFDRLPVLADALEDAGCANADLLGHLREPAPRVPHVRGCWALDLVRAKE
jgi:hypothetical protein